MTIAPAWKPVTCFSGWFCSAWLTSEPFCCYSWERSRLWGRDKDCLILTPWWQDTKSSFIPCTEAPQKWSPEALQHLPISRAWGWALGLTWAPRAGRRRSSTRGASPGLPCCWASHAPGGGYPGGAGRVQGRIPPRPTFPLSAAGGGSSLSLSASRVREKGAVLWFIPLCL